MKNHFIIWIIFLILLTRESYSQDTKGRFGFIGGVSVNELSYNFDYTNDYLDTEFTNTPKAAISLGMFAMYDIVKSFSLKFQGDFTIKGGITESVMSYHNSISYIQLSLLPQFNLPMFKNDYENIFYFNAGGYTAFKVGQWETMIYKDRKTEKEIINNLKDNDAGLIFSTGIVSEFFILNISYSHGFTNISNDAANSDFLSIKNRSLNISMGYIGGF